MTDYSSYDKEIGKLQPGKGIVLDSTARPDGQYHDATAYTFDGLKKLESDMEFLRSIITELYNKCPKTMLNMSKKKKKKKDDAVECENCGGLLW